MNPIERATRPPWWSHAVVYQVYLRSFADANGDGIGDLAGLSAHLDHLVDLGVDGLWLNPCYPSPQVDHGYDVADYFDIEPAYGTLAEFDRLVATAHERGLRVLMDVVPNHCSSEHAWFRAAVAAGPGSPERSRFIFRDGRGEHGELPPNNWVSHFGGPAWTRLRTAAGEPEQWYLHLFDAGQPDFDWRHPDVGDMFERVLRFWFDRGVDGFRIDVAHGLLKAADLPDWDGGPYNAASLNQPEVHDVYRRWRRITEEYGPDRALTLIGEIWVSSVTELAEYLRPDELHQAFFFDLLEQPWDATAFHGSIDRAFDEIAVTGSTVTWTLANHDVHRSVSRYGLIRPDAEATGDEPWAHRTRPRGEVDVELGRRRANAAALLLLALPGSVYLYQGEELGLPEVMDLPDESRQDPTMFRSGGSDVGRDGCRVPLPWTTEPASFGFSPTESTAKPWLPQPDWFADYAVSGQERDHDSALWLYRETLRDRRALFAPADRTMAWVPTPADRPDVLAFRRGEITCVVNFGDEDFTLPADWGPVLRASQPVVEDRLAGNATAWLGVRPTS